jgi:hypothetical protein
MQANWEKRSFDQSMPMQSNKLTLLIGKKILWSAKIGRDSIGLRFFHNGSGCEYQYKG